MVTLKGRDGLEEFPFAFDTSDVNLQHRLLNHGPASSEIALTGFVKLATTLVFQY